MSIKKFSLRNLEMLAQEIDRKYAGKDQLGAVAALDRVGEENLTDALKAVIQGKADAATTLAGYGITDGMTATEVADAIARAVAGVDHLSRKKVDSLEAVDLEAEDADRYIYLVPKADGGSGNGYDEYMVLDGALERMGDWAVNLADYAKTAEVLQAISKALDVSPDGNGNVVTDYRYNPETEKVEVKKGITALQESDFEEYTAEEIAAAFAKPQSE